nr:hypothetical protein [uncultured Acetatifactor sp.]
MFGTAEDGTLIYDGDTDVGGAAADGVPALFDVPQETDAPPGEGVLENPAPDAQAPGEAPADAAPEGLTGSGNSLLPPTGSGNAVYVPVASPDGDFSVTTSGDVYIYPELPDAEPLAEERSAYSATVTGLPNSSSLSYLEDVAAGYPSWYSYMCFKTDANYSQSMALWIGPKAEKSPSQDRIGFPDGVDCIEVRYVRSGSSSTYHYQYAKTHYNSYQIPYDSGVFLYTNAVDGYAALDVPEPFPLPAILFAGLAVIVLSLIFRGGGKQ